MQDHTSIGKFKSFGMVDKNQLEAKRTSRFKSRFQTIFTTIFSNLEDRDRVFENDPYFFSSAGLYLRPWTNFFIPKREDFFASLMWIHLYLFPQEFWEAETLEGIGNALGSFVKISLVTK
jgi:hypothetical protein